MNIQLEGKPAFTYLNIDLQPGESIVAEAGAMASMNADLDMDAKFNGGLVSALLKKLLGGESIFVNVFTNNTSAPKRLTLTQATPGDMNVIELNGNSLCLQAGAYICSSPNVKLGLKWAGLASLIAREGLFKLEVSGQGTVCYGAYGTLVEKHIEGEYIVDTAHLVAYQPNMKLKVQLSGNLINSLLSGEGFVTRIEGSGKVILQSRSMHGLSRWVNKYLY